MLSCPGKNDVCDKRDWYTIINVNISYFCVCEECYHKYIKNTYLNTYFTANKYTDLNVCCDISYKLIDILNDSNIKKDIKILMNYINSIINITDNLNVETHRLQLLFQEKGENGAISLLDDNKVHYYYNGNTYNNIYDFEYSRIDDEIQKCTNKIQQLKNSLEYYQN